MERKSKKYDEANLILVDGEGKTREEIYLAYINLIVDDRFSLTVDEIASYLRCTYQHVIDKIVPEVLHIRITEVAKMILAKCSKDYEIDESISSLFTKRILFNREDFERYITDNAQYIISYHRFYEQDFHPAFINEMKKSLDNTQSFKNHMQFVMDTFLWKHFKNEPITLQFHESFPGELYSQKDLTAQFGLNYKVQFYRRVDNMGLNKVKIGHMIRYRKEEVEEVFLCRMYITAFLRLKDRSDYIKAIQDRALELLE